MILKQLIKISFLPLYIGLTFIIGFHNVNAQQANVDNIIKPFNTYREQVFHEKLYVHLDQTFYLTGEILWFKIYTVDGTLHKPSKISKVAYLEIIDKDNKPVLQTKIGLQQSVGGGSLFIPATIPSGNYYVRAYTQWMRNFDAGFYFHKPITIVNPFVKPEVPEVKEQITTNSKPTVEFFPEGGNLVSGLRSKIGFKITSTSHKGIEGKIAVINADNDTVATSYSGKFGLGNFYLTPNEDVDFKIVLTDQQGNLSYHKLPRINASGYVMEVKDSTEALIKVSVRYKNTNSAKSLAYAYLLVHSKQVLIQAEAKPFYPDEAVFIVPANALPDGVSHFTIFDGNQNPVCERLYFTIPKSKLAIQTKMDQQQYGVRRKVSLQVKTSTPNQRPVPANISLSVYKMDSLSGSPQQGIFEYLNLSSDVKGYIESPEYYFNDQDPAVKKAADNLMLTHGWRRFTWEDVFSNKTSFSFVPEYRGHLIKGKVSSASGNPATGIITYMASPGKLVWLYGSRSNAQGEILFEAKDLVGPQQLVVQTNTTRDSTYNIMIENPFSADYVSMDLPPYYLSPMREQELVSRSLSMQVQDIYNRDNIERYVATKRDSFPFYGKADQRYLLDDYTRFPVMEEVMREYVPGVLVRKRRDGFHFIVINKIQKGTLADEPLVLLDGMPVFDVDKIMEFDPLKIKALDVVMSNYYLGPLIIPGIISYTTYQGDLGGFKLNPRSLSINYEGLQRQREFYAPQYGSQKQRNSRIADQRNLLFWSPIVTTNKEGFFETEFYTSDQSGTYQVVVEGLTSEGLSGTGVNTFSVKRADY